MMSTAPRPKLIPVIVALFVWVLVALHIGARFTVPSVAEQQKLAIPANNAYYTIKDNQKDKNRNKSNNNSQKQPIIDIVSVGSLQRPEYQDAQKDSFGSHPNVRHFFLITENDDVDQGKKSCHNHLTWEQVKNISAFCHGKQPWITKKYPFQHPLRSLFGSVEWLGQKANPTGWLCAQKRPIAGFQKAVQHYRKNPQEVLPDFLFVADDDTYISMNQVLSYLKSFQEEKLQELGDDNFVLAGCVIKPRIPRYKITFPYGGWGTIFSQGTLKTLMEPLHCSRQGGDSSGTNATDRRIGGICKKLQENKMGEYEDYKEGMSLWDVIFSFVKKEPYVDQATWTLGFCFHSDWVWGCKLVESLLFVAFDMCVCLVF